MCNIIYFKDNFDVEELWNKVECSSGVNNDAWGVVAVRRDNNEIVVAKFPGRPPLAFKYCLKNFKEGAVHLRLATHGAPLNNFNNHPFKFNGGWVMHNGVIYNSDKIAERFSLQLESRCDSEILARLLDAGILNLLNEAAWAGVLRTGKALVFEEKSKMFKLFGAFVETGKNIYESSPVLGLPRAQYNVMWPNYKQYFLYDKKFTAGGYNKW